MSPQNRRSMNGSAAAHGMSQFVQFLHKLSTNDTPDHLYEKYPYYKVVDIEEEKNMLGWGTTGNVQRFLDRVKCKIFSVVDLINKHYVCSLSLLDIISISISIRHQQRFRLKLSDEALIAGRVGSAPVAMTLSFKCHPGSGDNSCKDEL